MNGRSWPRPPIRRHPARDRDGQPGSMNYPHPPGTPVPGVTCPGRTETEFAAMATCFHRRGHPAEWQSDLAPERAYWAIDEDHTFAVIHVVVEQRQKADPLRINTGQQGITTPPRSLLRGSRRRCCQRSGCSAWSRCIWPTT
ncbi:hypothetical protein QJS66_14575 [Kocuria rhizophila]|nr:hypothetical protein QJS66_14575 [Kocuria rhizophila]